MIQQLPSPTSYRVVPQEEWDALNDSLKPVQKWGVDWADGGLIDWKTLTVLFTEEPENPKLPRHE